MKCTNKKWKLNKILICRFEEKRQKINDKFVLDEFITVFFAARIGQKKNQMSEDLRHILCAFIGWEICFKMEIYQLASCYWRFSRTDVKFK